MPRDPAEWKKAADEASTKELALVCFGIYAGMKMAIEDQKRADQKSKEST